MRIEEIDVTPEMAQAWLTASAGETQRRVTPRRVSMYAGAMQRDQWRVTHQAIAIDPAGVLIDGQHRLSAVVMARRPVRMSVAFDVPRETFAVIDTGQARTAAATLHIAGIPDANAFASAARAVLIYREIEGSLRVPSADIRSQFTSEDVLKFAESAEGAILKSNIRNGARIGQSLAMYGARSWIASALSLIEYDSGDHVMRAEFAEKWETGAMLAERTPVLTLRRWMTSEHGYKRADRAYRGLIGIGGALKAWNAWTTGQELSLIRIRPGRERWPMVGRDDIDAADAETIPDDASELDADRVDA